MFILMLPAKTLNVQKVKNGWTRGYISGLEVTGTSRVRRWLVNTRVIYNVPTVAFFIKWTQLVELKIQLGQATTTFMMILN